MCQKCYRKLGARGSLSHRLNVLITEHEPADPGIRIERSRMELPCIVCNYTRSIHAGVAALSATAVTAFLTQSVCQSLVFKPFDK